MPHARLSPSSSERWLNCPASVRWEAQIPKEELPSGERVYAREGTIAHALAEIRAAERFGLRSSEDVEASLKDWEKEFSAESYEDGTREEMEGHVQKYVDFIAERRGPSSLLLLERRVHPGVPECWGTSDAVIVRPDSIEIIDFKYGAGVPVNAVLNSQLRLYGLGALEEFGNILDTTETVTTTVFQPRLDSDSSETMPAGELLRWRDELVIPAANRALYGFYAPFGPGEKACRWCPFSGQCKAQLKYATERDFGDVTAEGELPPPSEPGDLTPEEMSRVLDRQKVISDWLSAFEKAALDAAYSRGVRIPGYKVVRSGGRRNVTDPTAVIQRFIDAGYKAEEVAEFKLRAIGTLEKKYGKETFEKLTEGYLVKSQGRESLVPESDKRQPISPVVSAQQDFQ